MGDGGRVELEQTRGCRNRSLCPRQNVSVSRPRCGCVALDHCVVLCVPTGCFPAMPLVRSSCMYMTRGQESKPKGTGWGITGGPNSQALSLCRIKLASSLHAHGTSQTCRIATPSRPSILISILRPRHTQSQAISSEWYSVHSTQTQHCVVVVVGAADSVGIRLSNTGWDPSSTTSMRIPQACARG